MRKIRRPRNLKYTLATGNATGRDYARFQLGCQTAALFGAVGQELHSLGAGKVRFLDSTPADTNGKLLVVAVREGLLVVYYDISKDETFAEVVWMCAPFREKIIGERGAIRWAKVVLA